MSRQEYHEVIIILVCVPSLTRGHLFATGERMSKIQRCQNFKQKHVVMFIHKSFKTDK